MQKIVAMEEFSNDEYRNGMDFVAGNIDTLRGLAIRICSTYHRIDLVDDMFCDAIVGNADRAFNKFNPQINDDLAGWMHAQFQFYCRKWFSKYSRRASRESQLDSDATNHLQELPDSNDAISALIRQDEVIRLLGELSEYEQRLIRLHYGFNNSFEEIADKIGGAASTLRIHCNTAVAKLQRLINRGCDNGN